MQPVIGAQLIRSLVGIGTGLSEPGDRAINQTRKFVFQTIVIEAVFFEPAGFEILRQDIAFSQELFHEGDAFGFGDDNSDDSFDDVISEADDCDAVSNPIDESVE